ncbi:MAG: glutathione S-transferase [Deltaproteobacteria bacterium]|jgi:glutathione S-transferase|nr:glutathione S-transferase [Deltaproteobacteria bacterium]
MNRMVDVGSSVVSTLLRGGAGVQAGSLGAGPQKTLELYDFENCPFCRKVREALTDLDLDAKIYPCPKGGERYRPALQKRGGKALFPYLVDPNTGDEMYESDDIIAHLYRHYGEGPPPAVLRLGPLTSLSSAMASAARGGAAVGTRVEPSQPPHAPLELWSFEASPFCRLVREKLCTLEIPYVLHNVGKGSPSRDDFVKRSGHMQVPWLVDPNTATELFESADIVAYLDTTYGA